MRYFLHFAYNGSSFHGWQKQPNATSIQEEVQKALCFMLKEKKEVIGCGRTDTGVHARDFYAHFDHIELSNEDLEMLTQKLNGYFHSEIRFFNILRVKNDASARFCAISRTYQYFVANQKQPFNNDFSLYYPHALDIETMNVCASLLMKYTDFTSFAKLHAQTTTNLCTVSECFWRAEGEYLVFTISANRFLRNMVRSVVGTLLDVGKGKLTKEEFTAIIEGKSRSLASSSADAKALFLTKVEYPQNIFLS